MRRKFADFLRGRLRSAKVRQNSHMFAMVRSSSPRFAQTWFSGVLLSSVGFSKVLAGSQKVLQGTQRSAMVRERSLRFAQVSLRLVTVLRQASPMFAEIQISSHKITEVRCGRNVRQSSLGSLALARRHYDELNFAQVLQSSLQDSRRFSQVLQGPVRFSKEIYGSLSFSKVVFKFCEVL